MCSAHHVPLWNIYADTRFLFGLKPEHCRGAALQQRYGTIFFSNQKLFFSNENIDCRCSLKQQECEAIWPTCHFANLPFCQLAILPTCHLVNLPFGNLPCGQLAIWPTCHLANLPFGQLAIWPTCHLANLPFCQLAVLSTPKLFSIVEKKLICVRECELKWWELGKVTDNLKVRLG